MPIQAQTQRPTYPPAGYGAQQGYPQAAQYPAPSPYPIPSQPPATQGYPSASQYPTQRQAYPTPTYRAPATTRAPAAQTPAYSTYQVKPGDTLWRIAMNHRVSPGEIMAANRMTNDTVHLGQPLIIPGRGQPAASAPPPQYTPTPSYPAVPPTASRPSAPTGAGGYHTIRPGDTFSEIALRYHVSQASLQKANPGIDPNRIPAGGVLVIPGGHSQNQASAPPPPYPQQPAYTPPPPSAPKTAAPKPAPPSGEYHTVNRGETLSVIAAKYRVSTNALARANGITNPNLIEIGQPLKIPPASKSYIASKPPAKKPVAKAPTKPTTVAKKSSTPPPPSTGVAAKAPTYPSSYKPAPLPATSSPSTADDSHRGVLSYRVDRTDSIESIASMFGTTPARIRQMNQMSPTASVKPSDEILVPAMGAVSLQ